VKVPEKTSYISLPILEKDELERIGYMIQRDNLLRNLGVPDIVYRLLNGIKPSRKPQIKSSSGKQINVYNVSIVTSFCFYFFRSIKWSFLQGNIYSFFFRFYWLYFTKR